ncbi:MAG: right-handed parallel beta-helix repeat-containing protein [Bryobacterales bacterium]|nr:right-handed parallel beta-helix repeat-containing protein [Bryobacterales bacterium]
MLTKLIVSFFAALLPALAVTYEVGPGRTLARLAAVPWRQLGPGDTVLVYWKPEPYLDKFVISRSGTAAAPITLRGVPGPDGSLPVLQANGAETAPGLRYFNPERGVVQIGGSDIPGDAVRPQYVVVENLEVRGARSRNAYFTAGQTSIQAYADNAAGIYIERGDEIVVRNCILTDNGNGMFVGNGKNVTLEKSYIYDNGYPNDDDQHHNVYLQSAGMLVRYNRFGPLKKGSQGNNIKDRSAGLVIANNWIEGGNRHLDLVDISMPEIRDDPRYRTTYVYGNVFIEHQANDNNQYIQYGGDGGDRANYRKGTLHLYNNTFISYRPKGDMTTWVHLTTMEERAEVRNNIVALPRGSDFQISYDFGTIELSNNYLPTNYGRAQFEIAPVVVREVSPNVRGDNPGLADLNAMDFRLLRSSPAIGAGIALPSSPASYPVDREYVVHRDSRPRPRGAQDLGAFQAPGDPTPKINTSMTAKQTSPYAYLTIMGEDLARGVSIPPLTGDFPTSVDGVQVKINGREGYLQYVSPTQINVLTPADTARGEVPLEVLTPFGPLRSIIVLADAAPVLFAAPVNDRVYATAVFALDGSLVTPSKGARAGDYVLLFATGLGTTATPPPIGLPLDAAYPVVDLSAVKVLIGGVDTPVLYAGMTYAGLFQINIQIPPGVRAGDQPLALAVGQASTGQPVFLPITNP